MKEFSILALGGNAVSPMGDPAMTLTFALKALSKKGVNILRESSRYVNPAFPKGSGPDFVNAVALVDSDYKPAELLDILHEVEAECGRVREKRWGPRTLDIDLIDAAGRVFPNLELYLWWSGLPPEKQAEIAPEQLILPHPRIQDRAFVLIPMLEVLPEWKHPVTGQGVAEMLSLLPESDRNEVVRLPNP
ncbi:2-amino-4-hydroxy-6-hydroxymethyldihydropteridine diphosphokinase [Cognatishimia activa]|uniref:2-amino-4-hydroxy-6- hydroxymethyldihydropteridine diphosphokinase n=1 Tax=Cognatishimia activa TaxID=1715691 RepID=UPI00223102C6|nr:2-amino-4-hydroxy-6-hydroxymethyldihydropteridine diphosphokinase [Cognatishimia activa]UZD90458.1 2-amino-4-hydroxy-6-hydroxymethyldihydropteridine diphosphokinase [Cognatishimia activa]